MEASAACEFSHIDFWCILYDTIRYDTIRYDTIRYDTIRYDTMRCDAMRCHAMPMRYDTTGCNYTYVIKYERKNK